jgi:hypothetical protein
MRAIKSTPCATNEFWDAAIVREKRAKSNRTAMRRIGASTTKNAESLQTSASPFCAGNGGATLWNFVKWQKTRKDRINFTESVKENPIVMKIQRGGTLSPITCAGCAVANKRQHLISFENILAAAMRRRHSLHTLHTFSLHR